MNPQLSFADKVLVLRRGMGLNQAGFAKVLGISRVYLSQIELGREPSKLLKEHFERIETSWNAERNHGARSKLKQAREAKGLSQKELAKAVGYSIAIYQDIEDGRSGMGEKMAKKIAKILEIDVSELMDGSDEIPSRNGAHGTFGAVPEIGLPPGMTAKYVPLLSMAQCGPSVSFDDGAYTGDGYLALDVKDPKAFALKLAGDSMQPYYGPGDVAIIYPSHPPRNGGLVVARLDDDHGGDVMLKLYQSMGAKVTLSSSNAAYQPMTWERGAFAWIYPVAQVMKNLMAV